LARDVRGDEREREREAERGTEVVKTVTEVIKSAKSVTLDRLAEEKRQTHKREMLDRIGRYVMMALILGLGTYLRVQDKLYLRRSGSSSVVNSRSTDLPTPWARRNCREGRSRRRSTGKPIHSLASGRSFSPGQIWACRRALMAWWLHHFRREFSRQRRS
jgi:hypothetical protein